MTWQPIDSAPRGNVPVLLLNRYGYLAKREQVVIGASRAGDHWYSIPGRYGLNPTHWHPLPQLPAPPTEGA